MLWHGKYLARHLWIASGKDGLWGRVDMGPPLPKPTPETPATSVSALPVQYNLLGNTWNTVTFDGIAPAGYLFKTPERSLWDILCKATATCNGVAVLGNTGKYLVQRVTITLIPGTPSIWMYRVEYGGRLLGIPDLLQALVSAQQKQVRHEMQVIDKYHQETENISMTDEYDHTLRTPPWVCGDGDAICGFVEVSS
ncbi:MAG: hypothetical protein WCY82_10780 [Desulfotomaculaceae bacterium]